MSVEVSVSEFLDVQCNYCGSDLTAMYSNGTVYVDACDSCSTDQYNEGHSAGKSDGNDEGYERGYEAATREHEENL